MADRPKQTRITIETEDGSSRFIEGAMLEKYNEMLKNACVYLHVHNANPDWGAILWTEVPAVK